VIELQRGIISQLGIDPEYGCSRLNRIGTDYGDDQEIQFKMQQFAMCAQIAVKEAQMSNDERT
jgi:hypothetical protein